MKHRIKKTKSLGREKSVRTALMRSLVVALVEHEQIDTTLAKAKELSKVIEPWVTKARTGGTATRRHLAKQLPPKTVKKLVDDIAPRYSDRPGGYTRIVKMGRRERDGAKMARISFV